MRRNTGRVLTALALVAVLALSGATAFADGGGTQPTPKPNDASTYTVVDGALWLLDAAATVVQLV